MRYTLGFIGRAAVTAGSATMLAVALLGPASSASAASRPSGGLSACPLLGSVLATVGVNCSTLPIVDGTSPAPASTPAIPALPVVGDILPPATLPVVTIPAGVPDIANVSVPVQVCGVSVGVLGNAGSHEDDSFSHGLLEGPSYTRPPSWRGYDVPAVLLSGDHAAILRWRRDAALRRTARLRPDLLVGPFDGRDREVLAQVGFDPPGTGVAQ